MENRAHALAAGLFMIVLLVAAGIVGNRLAGDPLERSRYRVVALQPVTGLNPQAQVRYRGISVGRVAAIELDLQDTRRILIDIEVEQRIPLSRGTYAQLGQEGITGIAYVHLLDDGADKAPLAGVGGGVPEIPLRASMLDDLFESAGAIAKDARALIADAQSLLGPQNRENLAATLASMKLVSENLDVAARRLPQTLARADRVFSDQNQRHAADALAALHAASRQLPGLVRELPELAREARQAVAESRRLLDGVHRLADEARGTAGDLRSETLPRAHLLADSLERGAERIGRLAYELERRPDSVIWGRPTARPGPGEAGFE